MSKPIRPDPFSPPDTDEQVLFFKVPLEFQIWQSHMTQPEKDIYIYFMIRMFYKKSLVLEESNESIRTGTGIKNEVTVRSGIRGLAEKGWIADIYYQKRASNKYKVNLKPVVNDELIKKMDARRSNTSKAKKASIANGEAGKFIENKDPETLDKK